MHGETKLEHDHLLCAHNHTEQTWYYINIVFKSSHIAKCFLLILQVFHCVHFECPAQAAEGNEEQESSDSDSNSNSSHPMDTDHQPQQPQLPRGIQQGSVHSPPRGAMPYQFFRGGADGDRF